jgi:hypothetical protein
MTDLLPALSRLNPPLDLNSLPVPVSRRTLSKSSAGVRYQTLTYPSNGHSFANVSLPRNLIGHSVILQSAVQGRSSIIASPERRVLFLFMLPIDTTQPHCTTVLHPPLYPSPKKGRFENTSLQLHKPETSSFQAAKPNGRTILLVVSPVCRQHRTAP